MAGYFSNPIRGGLSLSLASLMFGGCIAKHPAEPPLSTTTNGGAPPAEEVDQPGEVIALPSEAISLPSEGDNSPFEADAQPTDGFTLPSEAISLPSEAITQATPKQKQVMDAGAGVLINSGDSLLDRRGARGISGRAANDGQWVWS